METALTIEEVAQLLKISPRTVRRLAAKGEIPGRKIGNKWRFSPIAVHRWLVGDNLSQVDLPNSYQGGVETLLTEIICLLRKSISEPHHDTASETEKFYGSSGVERKTGNPHLDFYGALASNPLAKEVAASVEAEKERQRQIARSKDS